METHLTPKVFVYTIKEGENKRDKDKVSFSVWPTREHLRSEALGVNWSTTDHGAELGAGSKCPNQSCDGQSGLSGEIPSGHNQKHKPHQLTPLSQPRFPSFLAADLALETEPKASVRLRCARIQTTACILFLVLPRLSDPFVLHTLFFPS